MTKKTCYLPYYRSTIFRLQVLADLGLTRQDERIADAVKLFFDLHLAKDGGYSCRARRRQGTVLRGHLCTTGNMTCSLIRFGYLDDERVQTAISWLVSQHLQDGGWDCFGRTMGTLDAWEATSAFAEIPTTQRSSEVRHSLEAGAKFFLEVDYFTRENDTRNGTGFVIRGISTMMFSLGLASSRLWVTAKTQESVSRSSILFLSTERTVVRTLTILMVTFDSKLATGRQR